MKTLTPAMSAHLNGTVTTLATLWRVRRRDGVEAYFTDHDQDITYEGATYKASTGFRRSDVATMHGIAVDDLETEGILDGDQLTARDLRLGLWDDAEVWIGLINWADPSMGQVALRRGHLGEVVLQHNGTWTAELRGLLMRTGQKVLEHYQPTCRADLADARCQVDLSSAGAMGTVTAVTSASVFTADVAASPIAGASFSGGWCTWSTGDNAGAQLEVARWDVDTDTLTLFLGAVYPIEVGDTFQLVPGCNKKFTTCRDVFDNAINFRGEPFLPGSDMLSKYPGPNTGGDDA